jgi:serine/threonine protein kinase
MSAAHARGIVHRDLKPENVMITRDDQVKILDFGLAKPMDASRIADGEETRAVKVTTTAGTVLGTFGYMAPEQVRGLPVDHRADIFAFGAVLYEMLCGDRAFKGETAADTITAILTKDPPDLDVAKLAISPALDRIVRRCLEKTPELRFQSANDLAFALEHLSTTSTSSTPAVEAVPATRSGVAWLSWSIAGVAAVAAIAAVALRPSPVRRVVWQHLSQLTDAAGEETFPAITPDGTTVAYVMRQDGRWGVLRTARRRP